MMRLFLFIGVEQMYKVNEDYEKRIKEYFKDWTISALQIGAIRKFFKFNADIQLYIENILKDVPQYETITAIFQHILFNINLINCKTCRKIITVETKEK